jgi:hypothetical protein
MVHPAVSYCAARTKECSLLSIELDKHLAESHAGDMEMLNNSRDTIARSWKLLRHLNERK